MKIDVVMALGGSGHVNVVGKISPKEGKLGS